jgi:hypothetical protein
MFWAKHRRQSIDLVPRPAILDCHTLALDETSVVQASMESSGTESIGSAILDLNASALDRLRTEQ